jgi:hypothetical protein
MLREDRVALVASARLRGGIQGGLRRLTCAAPRLGAPWVGELLARTGSFKDLSAGSLARETASAIDEVPSPVHRDELQGLSPIVMVC